jgi:hypothetical protein
MRKEVKYDNLQIKIFIYYKNHFKNQKNRLFTLKSHIVVVQSSIV